MKRFLFIPFQIIVGIFTGSCQTIPPGANAVSPFQKEKYLGTWYEIARFDFTFEKNLNNTTATYSLKENGAIKVDNKGYNYKTNQWQQSVGEARFIKDDSVAMLKVSFFKPFYGGYNVIAIDPDYKYALVLGSSVKYLWILSREKTIPEDIRKNYLAIASKIGCKTDELIWVEHSK
jgi:apolipoprotein D and lipocalin family protein